MNEWSLGLWRLYVVSVSAITGFVVTMGWELVHHYIWWVRRKKRIRLIQHRQNSLKESNQESHSETVRRADEVTRAGAEEFRKKRRVWDGYTPEDTTHVSQDDIIAMIDRMAKHEGLDLASFYELGKNDQLTNPLLRELWLIWGDALTP